MYSSKAIWKPFVKFLITIAAGNNIVLQDLYPVGI
jgi:hypothetical protein